VRPTSLAIAEPHGDEEAPLQRVAQTVSVFQIQFWTALLLLIGSSAGASSAAAAIMRCRIDQQAWSPCRMVAARPGERWVLFWKQQRVEFVHDGTGQMRMRVGQCEDWREVQPFWTADHSLCWGDKSELRADSRWQFFLTLVPAAEHPLRSRVVTASS
tara:strand:+ start:66 stop:539 length:474 start_codon:yes stop_codon:yes gene_type:complete